MKNCTLLQNFKIVVCIKKIRASAICRHCCQTVQPTKWAVPNENKTTDSGQNQKCLSKTQKAV